MWSTDSKGTPAVGENGLRDAIITAKKAGDVGLKHVGPTDSEWRGFNQRAIGSHSRCLSKGVHAGECVFRKGDRRQRREKREGMSSKASPASHTPGILALSLSLRRILAVCPWARGGTFLGLNVLHGMGMVLAVTPETQLQGED